MQYAYSLKNRIADSLRAAKILSYEDIKAIAEEGGYKVSTAERRLRNEVDYLPVIKLNFKRKPIKNSERWHFVKWIGSKTVFKK